MRVPFIDLAPMTSDVRDPVSAGWSAMLDSNRFVGGEAVDRFESEWAEYCGTASAVGVGNGTDALELVIRAMGIGPGDEVILPANSFVATAEAVVLAGATPRFADVDPDTLLITPATAQAVLTARTSALIVVHLYGQPANMDALGAFAGRAGLAVIEDAAQAHGATWRGRMAGSLSAAGCFSFYPGKNLGAFGDAGAVVTSDPALAATLRSMRDHGRVPGSHYDHAVIGTNSRLDAMQAIVLSAKLAHLDSWNAARRRIIDRYRIALEQSPITLVAEASPARGVHHLAVARAPQRAEIRQQLDSWGIETGVHYPTPIHVLPPYRQFATAQLPVVEKAAGEVVSLPMYPHMNEEQVDRMCKALERVGEIVSVREAAHA